MQRQLSGSAEEIKHEKTARGICADAAEYVSELILPLEELKLETLRQALQIGIDQLNRGEGLPLNRGRINKKIKQALAARNNT